MINTLEEEEELDEEKLQRAGDCRAMFEECYAGTCLTKKLACAKVQGMMCLGNYKQ